MGYLDNTGLEHLWTIIVGKLGQKVSVESGKGLSTNDYTTAEKTKLANIAEKANNYSLPTASSTLGGVKTTSTVTSTTGLTATPIINGVPYYKDTITSYTAGAGLSLSGTQFKHSNAITAKTAYGSTATTTSANGGTITVTDVKYDAQGHITGSTDRKITLSQTTYTLDGLGGVPTSRTINGKALTSNISLTATDVGAATADHSHSLNDLDGVLSVANGGTGGTTADEACAGIGALRIVHYSNSYSAGCGDASMWFTYSQNDENKCQIDLTQDGKLQVNKKDVITTDGGTITGSTTFANDLYVSNDKSTGGYVKIWEDNGGGNIEIASPNGKTFQMDAYNDTTFRIFSQQSGSVKGVVFNGTNGNLSVDGQVSSSDFICSRSSGDTYFTATRTDVSNTVMFGIGTSGENRGIWDTRLNRWVFKITNSGIDLSSMGIIYSSTQPTAPWTGAIWLKPV